MLGRFCTLLCGATVLVGSCIPPPLNSSLCCQPLLCLAVALSLYCCRCLKLIQDRFVGGAASAAATPPKAIIWMLGDDYGYANVGFPHGPNPGNPEARTPTMDALVKEGVLLERHCTPPAPTQLRRARLTRLLCLATSHVVHGDPRLSKRHVTVADSVRSPLSAQMSTSTARPPVRA